MTQDKHLEIEAKILVPDLDAVRARLEADPDAACARPRLHEYNIRYEDASNALTPAGIVLRLRRDRPLDSNAGAEDRVRFTYKAPAEPVSAGRVGVKARFEVEVEVSDFETMDLILKRMGYHRALVYEKYRTTYELLGTEAVLDEMPFGSFVEVEGAPDAIEAVVARLGLAGARRFVESYTLLFEYVKINLGLTFRDLTFENFRDAVVPTGAFNRPGGG